MAVDPAMLSDEIWHAKVAADGLQAQLVRRLQMTADHLHNLARVVSHNPDFPIRQSGEVGQQGAEIERLCARFIAASTISSVLLCVAWLVCTSPCLI